MFYIKSKFYPYPIRSEEFYGSAIDELLSANSSNSSNLPIPGKVRDIPDDWITDIKASPNLEQIFVTTRENGIYIYTSLSNQWKNISTATYPNLPGNRLNTCVVNPANKDNIFRG